MTAASDIDGLKVLIIDDETDILETLDELLYKCDVETASDYETGARMLATEKYDVTIIDIMGVRGFDLLISTNQNGIPALILTSHGLSPENLVRSINSGANGYLPKDKMIEIEDFIVDLLEAEKNGQKHEHLWLKKLAPYFDQKFGKNWKAKDPDFWRNFEATSELSKGI